MENNKENVMAYKLVPSTEMRINSDGVTATTVAIINNTNQAYIAKFTDHLGIERYVITGWKK